ncbi:hypothetical protein JOE61_000003 [Nocardioides salarius]|uniref:Zinc ribbon domain-containing protein n=1 Tax=Nocardioides salarius TaxID=374513 RepID=A0ABS2M4T3_9ACTN|nr:zinc ribbon domain-containing protein [Nocardioides salarius]MBM7506189.1 hypothetical protein [Nocardioides salarius]
MPSYARPDLCPDCGAVLPPEPDACPRCGLPLRDPLADELLATLRHADELVVRLRARADAPTRAPATGTVPRTRRGPVPRRLVPRRLGQATVPQLLLALGAACLLVAAVVFLAVAWSWLGVAGRTAVLLVLTVSAGGASVLLSRRDLVAAAEALCAVTLGFVVLDVLGAGQSGWAPEPGTSGSGLVLGAVVVAAGLALSTLHLRLAGARPVVAQLVIAPALLGLAGSLAAVVEERTADGGAASASGVWAGCVVAAAALVVLAARTRLGVLRVAAGVVGCVAWLVLLAISLADNGADLSLRGLWAEGGVTWLLVAAALALLPLLDPLVRRGAVAVLPEVAAMSLGSLVLVLPALDEGADAVLVATGALVAVWGLAAAGTARVLPRRRVVPVGVALAFVLPVLVAVVSLHAVALEALLDVAAVYDATVGVRVDAPATAWDARLLVPAVLALGVAALGAAPAARQRHTGVTVGAALAVAALATAALLEAPLAAVVLPLALAATGLVALGNRRAVWSGLVVGAAGGVVALPSAALAAVAAGLVVLACGYRALAGRPGGAEAWAALPVAGAAALWAVGELAGVDVASRGAATVLVVGVLALVARRTEVDLATVLVVPWPAVAGVLAAGDRSVSSALHLTLLGALLVARALTDDRRRRVAWAGGLLLAAATWVRLADIGVEAPEAYTAPTALALLVVGLRALRRAPERGSVATLLPGLVLAVLPSLLWVLAQDPVSWRALLLGLGCLVLVLGGARLCWQAPLLVGAVAGGLLVLRELAPYAAATPQWVLLAAAGALLLGVGTTWERRVRDLRHAGHYLARLR